MCVCVCVYIAKADQDKKEPCVKNVRPFKWGVKRWGGRGQGGEKKDKGGGGAKVKRLIKGVFLVGGSCWG